MVAAECDRNAANCRVVIEPNCSLTWHEALIFFLGISLVSLSIATLLAIRGYWMVFPFTGAELLVLGACLYLTARRLRRREVILIDRQHLRIEQGRMRREGGQATGRPERVSEFPRGWVRVDLKRADRGWYPSRLLIGASGQYVEVGAFLPEDERQQLADELRRILRWDGLKGQPA